MDTYKFGSNVLNSTTLSTLDKVIVRDVSITVEATDTGLGEVTLADVFAAQRTQTGLNPSGGFTVSPRTVHTGGVPATATTSGTNITDTVATTIYFAECFVPCNMTVTGIALFNGTAVAGNGKVILYNSAGVKVGQSISTAMSGTTAYQLIPLTATYAALGPATYFIGCIFDTTTHDLRHHTLGTFATGTLASVTYATDSTLTPIVPTTTFTAAVGPIASLY
jgi:hypothetical protein